LVEHHVMLIKSVSMKSRMQLCLGRITKKSFLTITYVVRAR